MMKGGEYMLEIRTSATKGKRFEKKFEKERRKEKNRTKSNKHRSDNGRNLEKYISFTVKRPDYYEEAYIWRIVKILTVFFTIWVFWYVLERVDFIGKISKKTIDKDYEIKNLIYLGISVLNVKELYWRMNYHIEESLIIIPNFGIQLESVMIKESISSVIYGIIGDILRIDNGSNGSNGNNNNNNSNRVKEEEIIDVNRGNNSEISKKEEKDSERVVISKEFISMREVQDLVIQEGFFGMEVIYYMSLILREGRVIVIFPNVLPRRTVLESVWRKSREYI